MTTIFESYERSLASGRRFASACGLLVVMGWIAYWPMWRTYFFADDVDFFGGMCVALNSGRFWSWLWTPFNGHFSVPTKLGYFVVWRWGGRDVCWWHAQAMLVSGLALCGVGVLIRQLSGSRVAALAVMAVVSCSGAYRTLLMDPPCLNHFWAAGGTVWSLCAAVRFVETGRGLIWTIAFALLAFIGTAMGVLAFAGMLAIAAVLRRHRRRRIVLATAGIIGLAAAAAAQLALGEASTRPNLWFGLCETARGLNVLRGWVVGPMDFSRLFTIGLCCWLLMNWRRVEWRKIAIGAFLLLGPLLLATSFRSGFPGAGAWSRYAYLPLVGAGIWIGQAIVLPFHSQLPSWISPRGVAIVLFLGYVGCVWRTAAKNKSDVAEPPRELFALEQRLGHAVEQFAAGSQADNIELPTRAIKLPANPHERALDYVARYSVSARRSFRVVGVAGSGKFDAFLAKTDPELAIRLRD